MKDRKKNVGGRKNNMHVALDTAYDMGVEDKRKRVLGILEAQQYRSGKKNNFRLTLEQLIYNRGIDDAIEAIKKV